VNTLEIETAPQAVQADILILTVSHGASHTRTAKALQAAFAAIAPAARTEVLDALSLCARWFRAYYDSYLILLRRWPRLWGWIEGIQHKSEATGPPWLYRRGAQPLFRLLRKERPDIVVATEVGMCELAVLMKRHYKMEFLLAASCGLDVDRAWAQPEVDLFIVPPGDAADQLSEAGAPASKIHATGVPVDPAFATLPSRQAARHKLGLRHDLPVLLVLFGGGGFGDPTKILPQLRRIQLPVQVVFITGRNELLGKELGRYCQDQPYSRVQGWVSNIHEWMAAAGLLLSKPGASTVNEAITAGLPLVAFEPLPGNERRLCDGIEKWQVGCWALRTEDISAIVNYLLSSPEGRLRLRKNAQAMAQPHAARHAAEAVLECWQSQSREKRGAQIRVRD
jgi:processive 1,2-diacylglycerol beta-glucosyltransferase